VKLGFFKQFNQALTMPTSNRPWHWIPAVHAGTTALWIKLEQLASAVKLGLTFNHE